MDRSSVLRGDSRREDEDLTRIITAEHNQLGVEFKGLRVVQINITGDGNGGGLDSRGFEHAEV
jgi:hypothetical protein